MSHIIEPFHASIPEHDLSDLRERLSRIRWPDRETVSDNTQGPPLAKVRALCDYWLDTYDWRRCERVLNDLGSSRTTIDGLDIHFLHIRSPEPGAMPLLLTHGWPGSVLEFQDLIGPLTDPGAHGGNRADAFHLVIPSLPGFGFSEKPTATGWDVSRTADAWITLMDRLGYTAWGAQGGDWGAAVTTTIGYKAPAALLGLHLNMVLFQPSPDEVAQANGEEQSMLADAQRYYNTLSAYSTLQGTRPQTIGYSLADSPVGLAAWIYTLFQDVSDNAGEAENAFTMDQMLDDITLYWLTNTGPSSARLYWESMAAMSSAGPMPAMSTPTAISMFPREQVRLSRRWAEARFADLRHFNELTAGGHFAALEQPALLVDEIRTGFRGMR
jgi:epoxide hydrolase